MADPQWKVVVHPGVREHDGQKVAGMIVYTAHSNSREPVAQVAYDRSKSKNPEETFQEALDRIVEQARLALKVLNEDLAPATEPQ